ncbi:MAG: hypothetical protein GTO24_14680 [candidate division Zixibacteria bacterium]|nr:hypothetical protein [candidate division Zixibacteria bacterium]
MGEMQHTPDLVEKARIYAELGAITAGEKSGRTDSSEITLFDAAGSESQDLVTAGLALELSVERAIGERILM